MAPRSLANNSDEARLWKVVERLARIITFMAVRIVADEHENPEVAERDLDFLQKTKELLRMVRFRDLDGLVGSLPQPDEKETIH